VVDAVRSAFADDEATAARVTLQAHGLLRSTGTEASTVGTPHLVALVDLARGVALVREGDLAAGTQVLGTAAESTTATTFPPFLAMCRAYLALAEVKQGEVARARADAMHSLATTIRMGEPKAHSHAVALTALARLKLDDDPVAARRLLQPALESPSLRDDPVAGSVAGLVTTGVEHPVAPHTRRPQRTADAGWDAPVPDIVEDLTPKELEVLGHLAELLTTDEIADKMFVSVNTVRTHIRSILRKLGVNRRNAAIRKARRLHLLPR
jgi:DNA-binding CsgD family transcriptional regulator